jgi:hypothetical protein
LPRRLDGHCLHNDNIEGAVMSDITTVVDKHLAGYCEPDPDVRNELIAAAWAEEGSLIDPPFDGTGRDGIAAMADVVLTHYAGHTFRRTTEVDTHHQFGRYGWALVGPDGSVAVSGTDFIELDDGGRLVRIVGFFGDAAQN